MPTLSISEFSCIKIANFTLAPVNVIIGPQGSGKSVTTKLFYFCSDIVQISVQNAEKGETIDEFKKYVARQFEIWFPPSAWGGKRFNISYTAGRFSIRILRRKSKGKLSDSISVAFSEWFSDFYEFAKKQFDDTSPSNDMVGGEEVQAPMFLDKVWRVREIIFRRASQDLGNEFIQSQTFIPAGRAFFTSIGRLVAGFEQAGSLDPVTRKFARIFANLRDRNSRYIHNRINRLDAEFINKRMDFMNKLFGGELVFQNDNEFVETKDGRKIPFSSLSSGQQELLPMWSLINYFGELDIIRENSSRKSKYVHGELMYIEEPEAHLFPTAQSTLMEFLIGETVHNRNRRSLIITTHSPYIMSKLNVFLKAGQLSRRKKRNSDINQIVPRACWINENQLSASAIGGGRLRNLLDDEGLIDGTYLDEISEHIGREFSELLQIESEI